MQLLKTSKLLFLFVFLGLSVVSQAQTAVSSYGQLAVQGNSVVDQNGNDVQLQGMSLFWSQWQPRFYNKNTIEWLRDDWCLNVIRAAMAVESDGYLTNPEEEEAKVRAVIEGAIDLGVYVIVDWHDHNAHNHQAQAVDFFSRIAQDYGQYPNVIYETFNEPLNISWDNTLKPYHEAVISAIRQHDSDNIIVCGTPNWSQDVDDASNNKLSGANIAYTLHYYAGTHGASLRSKANTARSNGACLFVTEYGNVNADGDGGVSTSSANTWYDWMEDNKISHCNWAVSDKVEGASILNSSASSDGNWSSGDITTAGNFVRDYLKSKCPTYSNNETPPSITEQPGSAGGIEGDNVTITVVASGTGLSYQWKKNGNNISGANSSTLTLSNIQSSDAGVYTVVVSNEFGSETSNNAELTVLVPGPYSGSPIPIPGKIEIEEYDVGGQGVTYNDLDVGNTGGDFRNDDVDIELSGDSDGSFNVGWIQAGEWLEYTVDVAASGVYDFEFRVASTGTMGGFHLDFGGNDVTGTVAVPSTGDWQDYETVTVSNVTLSAGQQKMRFEVETAGFNINHVTVTSQVIYDCAGVANGNAYYDECEECVGGNTGEIACVQDCNNEWGGTAEVDDCSVCAGGSTGIVAGESCVESTPYGGTPHEVPGTIEAEDFDLGGSGVAYSDESTANEGGEYRTDQVDVEQTDDLSGDYNIGYTDAGEWLKYTIDVAASGTYDFDFRVASNVGGGEFAIDLDGQSLISAISVGNTGGWQSWSTISEFGVYLEEGVHVISFNILTGGFNLNYVVTTATQYDCNNDPHGAATSDVCGVCSGGLTGVPPNSDPGSCVIATNGIEYENKKGLFPNPTTGFVYFNEEMEWNVMSIDGYLMKSGNGSRVDLSEYTNGVYFIRTNDAVYRIVKQ